MDELVEFLCGPDALKAPLPPTIGHCLGHCNLFPRCQLVQVWSFSIHPTVLPEFDLLSVAHRDVRAGFEEGNFTCTLLNLHMRPRLALVCALKPLPAKAWSSVKIFKIQNT
jgi:hypothetical protein